MSRQIRISAGTISALADLDDSATAEAIWNALPTSAEVNRWGEEIYFDFPEDLPEADNARQDMEIGELAYWPAGPAFCIFFGRTPVSIGAKPRAYSNVNPFGRVQGDATLFAGVATGETIRIEAVGA